MNFTPQSHPILVHNKHFPTSIIPLQEEASPRKYFLVEYQSSNKTEQFVFCEATTPQDDFISLSQYFFEKKFPVPQVLQFNSDKTQILQTFEGKKDTGTLSSEKYEELLPEILDLILDFQSVSPPEIILNRSFNFEKLFWEVEHTIKGIQLYNELKKTKIQLTTEAKAFLEESCAYLDRLSQNTVCHRDFHCRNLLLTDSGEIRVIDFQDARMGSHTYDLASLLYDAYKPLTRIKRIELLELFRQKAKSRSINLGDRFLETYYLQCLQRSFKALGTYFHMTVQGKLKFESSIVPCLDNLLEITQLGLFPDSIYLLFAETRYQILSLSRKD